MRERLPDTRPSVTRKFKIPYKDEKGAHTMLKMYVIVGLYADGRPGEVFISADKAGSLIRGALDALATTISIALQHGAPLETILDKYKSTRFEPAGVTGDQQYPIVTSVLDYMSRWMGDRFKNAQESVS